MSLQVPLAAVPAQTLSVVLDNQNCQLELRTVGDAIYFSLAVDNEPILTNHICRNRTRMLLATTYAQFRGDFVFVDTQPGDSGPEQPSYEGLDSRFLLLYLTQAEVDAG